MEFLSIHTSQNPLINLGWTLVSRSYCLVCGQPTRTEEEHLALVHILSRQHLSTRQRGRAVIVTYTQPHQSRANIPQITALLFQGVGI